MNNVDDTGSWQEQKRKLKEKLDFLIRNSLMVEDKKEEMMEKLQIKLGISKEELRRIVEGF